MFLKVPSFPALFHFVSLSSLPHLSSFCVLFYFSYSCFHLILFPLGCFLLSRFRSMSLPFFFTIFVVPFLSFFIPIFTVASVSCDCYMSRGLQNGEDF